MTTCPFGPPWVGGGVPILIKLSNYYRAPKKVSPKREMDFTGKKFVQIHETRVPLETVFMIVT